MRRASARDATPSFEMARASETCDRCLRFLLIIVLQDVPCDNEPEDQENQHHDGNNSERAFQRPSRGRPEKEQGGRDKIEPDRAPGKACQEERTQVEGLVKPGSDGEDAERDGSETGYD